MEWTLGFQKGLKLNFAHCTSCNLLQLIHIESCIKKGADISEKGGAYVRLHAFTSGGGVIEESDGATYPLGANATKSFGSNLVP